MGSITEILKSEIYNNQEYTGKGPHFVLLKQKKHYLKEIPSNSFKHLNHKSIYIEFYINIIVKKDSQPLLIFKEIFI